MKILSQYNAFMLRHQLMSIISRCGTSQSEFVLHAKLMLMDLDLYLVEMGWLKQSEAE